MWSGPKGGRIDADELDGVLEEVRTGAAKIIGGKGNTNLAIGLATARIVRSTVRRDQRAAGGRAGGGAGSGEVCLSLPSVVGREGVLSRLVVPPDAAEADGLRATRWRSGV